MKKFGFVLGLVWYACDSTPCSIATKNYCKPFRRKHLLSRFGMKLTKIWVKALAHYNDFHKDFSKKMSCENRCPYIKLLKTLLRLLNKVSVCMDDNNVFVVSVGVCEGPKTQKCVSLNSRRWPDLNSAHSETTV